MNLPNELTGLGTGPFFGSNTCFADRLWPENLDLPPSTLDLAGLAWSQLWQVTALAAVVGIVTRLCCRRRPHLAYVLWMLVLLKCLTPPLWSSPTGFFSWAQLHVVPARTEVRSVEADVAVADSDDRAVAAPVFQRPKHVKLHFDPSPAVAPAMPVAPIAAETPRASWRDHVSITGIVAVVWLVGALALAGLLQWKWSSYCRKLKRSAAPADAAIELLAAQLSERLGLRRKFRVVVTTEPIGPAVFGLLRPTVVLPQTVVAGTLRVPPASSTSRGRRDERHTECAYYEKGLDRLEPILAHELVHLRRGDTYCGALQLAVEVLWWFHPLVWWANRETCRQRERCCDEEVVAGLKYRPAAYARCLLDVLELERNWQPMLAVPGVRFMEVTSKRLEDIMNRSSSFHAKTPRWIWAVLIVAAALVLPGKALVLGDNEPSPALDPSRSIIKSAPAINHAAKCLAFSPDSRTLAGGMHDGKLTFWGASNGKENKTVATGKSCVRAILFLPDGKNVLTAAQSIKHWNMKTGQCVKSVDLEDAKPRTSIKAFSHDGAYVAGTSERTLLLWDAKTGRKKQVCSLIGLGLATAFSPDDRLIAVGTMVPMGNKEMKSGVQIWDVKTGQLKRTILEPSGSISGLAFSHNGKLLAGGTHREAIVWDAETGAVQKRLPGGHGPIESIAFSPDDRLLAAGGQGPESRTPNESMILSELNVWNLASGKKVLAYLGSSLRVTSAVFSHDGKRIAACDNREVSMHDLTEKEPVWTAQFDIEAAPETPQPTSDASGQTAAASGDAIRKASADRDPTLAEIAKANEATWNAIRTIDMEYTQTSRYMYNVMGNKQWIEDSVMGRWLKAGNQERLKRSSKHDYYDYYIDDVAERELSEPHRKDVDYGRLSPVDVKDVNGSIYPKNSRMLARRVFFSPSPEVLRYFYLYHGDFQGDMPLTLAEVIATWKVTLKRKTLSAANDTLWLLHANYPGKYYNTADSYIDFYVNANKGFLVEKAFLYESNSCIIDGKTVGRCHSIEIKEYQALGGGVFFPKRSEYRNQVGVERVEQISADKCDRSTWTVTKLTLNAPLASDAFDFRFPAGVTVYKHLRPNEYRVYIWGPDNKPAQTFASEYEYSRFKIPEQLEEMRQTVEKRIASKKPEDLIYRGEYYMCARKYDEAIAMFTQWLAADPKLEERITALHQRAMTHILKEDYDKAVADLTEAMRLVEKLDKKDDEKACWAGFLYLFRGLAYASQGNTADKAMDDLTKIQFVPHEHEDFPEGYWAPLFRTAIRLRHLDFSSVGQVKAKTGREAKRSVIDILGGMGQDKTEAQSELLNTFVDLQGALGNREGPEAYAMMIYFLDKLGDHEMAAKHREAAKRETSHGTAPDIIAMVIDDAFQKCFARLAPEIEKRAVVIREARARNNESPY